MQSCFNSNQDLNEQSTGINTVKSINSINSQKYLDYLIDPSFHGVNRIFVLSFENEADRKGRTRHYLRTVNIKDCNVMIDGTNSFINQLKII